MAKASDSLSSRNKFAKRHYEAIALAIQEARFHSLAKDEFTATDAINAVIAELSRTFAADNGMFKRDRFVSACEPGANVRARNGGSR
jgi:hypothetical protein